MAQSTRENKKRAERAEWNHFDHEFLCWETRELIKWKWKKKKLKKFQDMLLSTLKHETVGLAIFYFPFYLLSAFVLAQLYFYSAPVVLAVVETRCHAYISLSLAGEAILRIFSDVFFIIFWNFDEGVLLAYLNFKEKAHVSSTWTLNIT